MKCKKYTEVDTRLPGEKRKSKFRQWFESTKVGGLITIYSWFIKNYQSK